MMSSATLSFRIKEALNIKYGGTSLTSDNRQDISRVVKCWEDFAAGKKLERYIDSEKQIYQRYSEENAYSDHRLAQP